MADDYIWTFDPDRGDGGIAVNKVSDDMPEYRPGKTYSMSMMFWDEASIDGGSAGGTLGGSNGFTLGGSAGATLSGADLSGHLRRYTAVREYGDYAGRYATVQGLDGTVNVADRTPDSAPVNSIIVALEPGRDHVERPGLWVALDDLEDDTWNPQDMAKLSARVTVLARRDDYDTRTDLMNDIGVTI